MMAPSLKSLTKAFIESLAAEKGYSENTCRAYTHDLKEFASFIFESWFSGQKDQKAQEAFRADQIDGLMIRGYLGFLHKKNKKATIARKLSTLRSFFNFLERDGLSGSNPAGDISSPKLERSIPSYLPVDEMFRLFEMPDKERPLGLRDLAILEVLYSCGIRVAELAGLNLSWV